MEDGGWSDGRWSDDFPEDDQMMFHFVNHYVQDEHGAPPRRRLPYEGCLKEAALRRLPQGGRTDGG